MLERARNFLSQPDVRANPFKGLWKRLRWKAHWLVRSNELLRLNDWSGGISILLPKSGSAAQVFYREFSDPAIVRGLRRILQPGMCFVDVGAHVGEYSLIAAGLVGTGGEVHAIEPQPDLAAIIRQNAAINHFEFLRVHECGLGAESGTAQFACDPHSKGGWLAEDINTSGTFTIPLQGFDEFCVQHRLGRVHLLKLDAAGNELAALRGGLRRLSGCDAPALLIKFYHPRVIRERFGYDSGGIRVLLDQWNYRLYTLDNDSPKPFDGTVSDYCVSILATRDVL